MFEYRYEDISCEYFEKAGKYFKTFDGEEAEEIAASEFFLMKEMCLGDR